jgi:SAM-dependent methyltransferase
MRLYRDLACWYPLVTTPGEYAGEADHVAALVATAGSGQARTLLELGAGAGHLASHLKQRFACTLSDREPEMLALSRALNPECEHVAGDMRSLSLGRYFDAVLIHDAVGYLTSTADLAAAMATTAAHLVPGGVAVFLPDHVRDTFAEGADHGGFDGTDGRALRYLEWTHDPDPADTTITADYAFLIREADGTARVEHDRHILGLFDRTTWHRLMEAAGLDLVDVSAVPDPYPDEHEVFVGRKRR